MSFLLRLWVYGLVILASASVQAQGVLEIPGDEDKLSGIGLISGWKCDAGTLTVSLNGGEPIPLTGGQRRDDTGRCAAQRITAFIPPSTGRYSAMANIRPWPTMMAWSLPAARLRWRPRGRSL